MARAKKRFFYRYSRGKKVLLTAGTVFAGCEGHIKRTRTSHEEAKNEPCSQKKIPLG